MGWIAGRPETDDYGLERLFTLPDIRYYSVLWLTYDQARNNECAEVIILVSNITVNYAYLDI